MTIKDQAKILQKHFGGKFIDPKLPEGDYYVVPKVKGSYADSVNLVLEKIKSTRPFYNWRKDRINDKQLRRTEKTREALDTLYKAQKGDYIVVQAQMGSKYKGKSVKTARESFDPNVFGLGAFEVGCILLTHPELLQKYEDLWFDCSGDDYDYYAVGDFSGAPSFYWHDGGLCFNYRLLAHASEYFGSVSAFGSQKIDSRKLDIDSFESRLLKLEEFKKKMEGLLS